ncbi:hypothetical protein PV325_000760 [Microctonus aethiopoides]|uniref:Uncharacterized protein n=1 Tax=Microctonus aethiopoides TaxID=144406 RepID=A0AA39C9R1_9HYME|nr:hypothetical protein PV325_000760 [Microctonus aethiopoides]KAK0092397.1 hypothetical protein PV326_001531 [Microctonus aethiopoides]KAK0160398.1 hypothetical protein PV328_007810 [Microctonus aethiopoides]
MLETKLTEFELIVIGIVGDEYIEESKFCANNVHDGEDEVDKELERRNESVLLVPPQVISICPNIPPEISEDTLLNINDQDYECNQSWIHYFLMSSNADHHITSEFDDNANAASKIPIKTIDNQFSSRFKKQNPYS